MIDPSAVFKNGMNVLNKNAPAILTAFGAVGVVSTAVLTARATIAAMERIQEEQIQVNIDNGINVPLTRQEKIKLVWPLYIDATVSGVLSCGAIVMSHRISSKRAAVLAAAYALNEQKLEEYQDKIKEKLGVKKEEEARSELNQEQINSISDAGFAFANPTTGKVWIVEEYSGTPFLSTIEDVKRAANEINAQLNLSAGRDGIKLAAFHKLLGLPSVSMADYVGFTPHEPIELHWTTGTSPDGSIPVHVFEYANRPTMELGASFR